MIPIQKLTLVDNNVPGIGLGMPINGNVTGEVQLLVRGVSYAVAVDPSSWAADYYKARSDVMLARSGFEIEVDWSSAFNNSRFASTAGSIIRRGRSLLLALPKDQGFEGETDLYEVFNDLPEMGATSIGFARWALVDPSTEERRTVMSFVAKPRP